LETTKKKNRNVVVVAIPTTTEVSRFIIDAITAIIYSFVIV
jgi:hypothetical protein